MACLVFPVDVRLVILTLLEVAKLQINRLVSPDSTCEENCEEGPITLAPRLFAVGRLPQAPGLFGREPVPEADSELLDALDAANAGRRIRTREPAIPEVDGTGCQTAACQVNPIP